MILRIKVKPNARVTEIISHEGDSLHVAVAAPPDKNKANKELIRFLTKELGRPVRIKSGLTSKEKIIEVM